jgi:hypothetical protein
MTKRAPTDKYTCHSRQKGELLQSTVRSDQSPLRGIRVLSVKIPIVQDKITGLSLEDFQKLPITSFF